MLPHKRTTRKRREVNYHRDAYLMRSRTAPPIALTQATPMHLLDLDDYCLLEIFSQKSLNLTDLCSVAESCMGLKQIARRIFAKSYKIFHICPFGLKTLKRTRRIFHNFGSLIEELEIRHCLITKKIFKLIAKYCSETLKLLKLHDCTITKQLAIKLKPTFRRLTTIRIIAGSIEDAGTLFSDCASLVTLKIVDQISNCENMRKIFESQFPKLERFRYSGEYDERYNIEAFITNHKNLKELRVDFINRFGTALVSLIANNCKVLEKLEIDIIPPRNCTEFVRNLRKLLTLQNLKELKIDCEDENITEFLKELPKLTSLKRLHLISPDTDSDSAFLLALCQLKNLVELRLIFCGDLVDIKPLACMEQLKELWLVRCGVSTKDAILYIIKQLRNLEVLVLGLEILEFDTNLYSEIADIVSKRAYGFPSYLKLGVDSDVYDEIKPDVPLIQNVKLVKLDDLDICGDEELIHFRR